MRLELCEFTGCAKLVSQIKNEILPRATSFALGIRQIERRRMKLVPDRLSVFIHGL